MKRLFTYIVVAMLLCSCSQFEGRVVEDFNFDWRFTLGDDPLFATSDYNDSHWRELRLPHDWAIEGEFSQDNPSTVGGGALPGGIGWYRKQFATPARVEHSGRVAIEFDGVFMNSTVYVNGTEIATRPYGYSSFSYDITPYLHTNGAMNVIAVRCDNEEQPNSRWYAECGIYRNVRMVVTEPIFVAYCGTYVTTPIVEQEYAMVDIVTTIHNSSQTSVKARLRSVIYDPKGGAQAESIEEFELPSTGSDEIKSSLKLDNPKLWDIDSPHLYTLHSYVEVDNSVVDTYTTTFGVRTFAFTPQQGFELNGRSMKLKGVCLHHDLGALGAAVHKEAIRRQLRIMQTMGCNAIRTAHNPPAPELLDLCDQMGILVIDEALDMWRRTKTEYDYSRFFDEWHQKDITDFIMRDRNHPSVIMWSVGNEILEQWNSNALDSEEMSAEERNRMINYLAGLPQIADDRRNNSSVILTHHIVNIAKSLDPTRPVTAGCNELLPHNNLLRSEALDIYGFNYHTSLYDSLPNWYPSKPMYASETVSSIQSRGYYEHPSSQMAPYPQNWWESYDTPHHQCSAYDNSHVNWGDTHERSWIAVRDRDYMAGTFIWTGFDYIGEPTPYSWPSRSSYFGIVDLCGFPKDVYYMYCAEWTETPTLHIYPHWNWSEGEKIDIWAYYNCADEVELFLNGRSLGRKSKSKEQLHALWQDVSYERGEVVARSYKEGKVVKSVSIKSATEVVSLRLTPEQSVISADGYDLCFVKVEALDRDGVVVPTASDMLKFNVLGAGELVGVDNGNPADTLSLKGSQKALFSGKALAVVRSYRGVTGKATLNVEGVGDGVYVEIDVKK